MVMKNPTFRRRGRAIARAIGLLAAIVTLGNVVAAPFSDRAFTIVVPYADKGPTAQLAYALVPELSRALGQEVKLSFRGGAGGTKGTTEVFESGGDDGHTLLLHNIGMASAPSLYKHLPYDPVKDFVSIGRIADAPMLLLGRGNLPVSNARELWNYIKANKNELSVAYGGPGGAGQLCGLMLERALKVKLFWIPFKGTGPALADLEKGRSDLLCDQTTHTLKAIDAGKVKAFALATQERLDVRPEIPTTIESGIPALQITVWHGLFAVKGIAPATVDRLSRALQAAVTSPTFLVATRSVGVVAASAREATPEAMRELLVSEITRWRPLIVATGQYAD